MSAVPVPASELRGRVTQLRVVRSEWTKLWTVRSTNWSLFVAVVLTIGFPILASAVISSHWAEHDHRGFNPLDPALVGSQIAQLAIGVLGVLVVTAEYSTGMIRATLTAVPKRLPVLWAKAGVFAVVTFALMLPSVLAAFFVSQAILRNHHILEISLSDPGVLRAVLGGAAYVVLTGIFALGIGAIVRNTAGGIAVFAGIFFVIPPLMNVLPTSWNNAVSQYLPSNAGRQLFALHHASHELSTWPGGLLFVGYCALVIAIAAVLLERRDV